MHAKINNIFLPSSKTKFLNDLIQVSHQTTGATMCPLYHNYKPNSALTSLLYKLHNYKNHYYKNHNR